MNDQQFLVGMWQKAEQLERDEREIRQAKKRHQQLRRRSLAAGTAIILFVAAMVAISLLGGMALTGLAILPLVGGFIIDSINQTDKGAIRDESY